MSAAPPTPVQDTARLGALHRTALLDTPSEQAFDRFTWLAATILKVPVALVSLVDHDRQFFKSCVGLPEPLASQRETPLSHSICQHVVTSRQPLIIPDARKHPIVHKIPAITDYNVVAYAGIPLITSDGHALGTLCVIDVQPRFWPETEIAILQELAVLVMTEIELRQQTQEARQALQSRDELLAIVTHDLKNPVSVIHSYVYFLQQHLPPQRDRYIERLSLALAEMRVATRNLAAQIDELLDVARLQAGEALELHPRSVDLVALVREVVAEQEQTTTQHRLSVTTTPELVGLYDPGRVRRVLMNLISNALKYSPYGGEVDVVLTQVEGKGTAWAVVSIRDHGLGIPAQDLGQIFARFSRGSNVIGRIPGTGIGLASAQQIVAQHGGTIEVASVEGEGSTFTVRLPLKGERPPCA